MRKPYPDDLNDKECEQIGPILEQVKKIRGALLLLNESAYDLTGLMIF